MKKHIHIGLGIVIIAGLAAAGYVSLRSNGDSAAQQSESAVPSSEADSVPSPSAAPEEEHVAAPVDHPPAKPAPEVTKEQAEEKQAAETPRAAPAKVAFTVNAGSFYYVPNTLKVKKGDTVTINLVNDGGFHDFTLDEFGVKLKVGKTGETTTVSFVADKAGSFGYYCSVGRHRELGQKGTIVVE